MRRLSVFLAIFLSIWLHSAAQSPADTVPLKVSLITCWPGTEVYELYGHTALRIEGVDPDGLPFDSVWNYGIFSYNEPNFIGRFVKGEMRYQVAGYPFAWFMPEYVAAGRRVEEQTLRLTPEQAASLRRALQINCLPQNKTYLYDYVKDNCSTRIFEQMESAAGPLSLPDSLRYRTYREAMRSHHRHYPWYSLGIDVALAYPVDTAIAARDQLFLPLVLHDEMAAAKLPDGSPAVSATTVLNAGLPDATLAPTPWYATPLFWAWLLFAFAAAYCFVAIRRRRTLKWLEAIYFALVGLAGCVVTFLVFFSIHRAASPNLLLLWLNPLAFVVPAFIWSRRLTPIVVAYMAAQSIVIIVGICIWPFQTQCGNPAFIPLILTELMLALTYFGLYLYPRKYAIR